MEKTLVLIKPDGLQRGLVGEVTRRLETKGLKLVGMKMMTLEDSTVLEHYAHISDKPFFPGVKDFMQSTPVIAQCWEGHQAVDAVRVIVGVTNSRKADAGSIRGDLSMGFQCNIVHASDTIEAAEKEVKRFFQDEEIFDYNKTEYMHIYSQDEL